MAVIVEASGIPSVLTFRLKEGYIFVPFSPIENHRSCFGTLFHLGERRTKGANDNWETQLQPDSAGEGCGQQPES